MISILLIQRNHLIVEEKEQSISAAETLLHRDSDRTVDFERKSMTPVSIEFDPHEEDTVYNIPQVYINTEQLISLCEAKMKVGMIIFHSLYVYEEGRQHIRRRRVPFQFIGSSSCIVFGKRFLFVYKKHSEIQKLKRLLADIICALCKIIIFYKY